MALNNSRVYYNDSVPSPLNGVSVDASCSSASASMAASTSCIPSSSSSSTTVPPLRSPPPRKSRRESYLDVPSFHRPSRPSLDSTYSEFSELSYHLTELRADRPLIRSISPASRRRRLRGNGAAAAASTRPPKSRILAAWRSFWVTNYGAFLVILAQFFGVGMNISTRLLETPGPHGEPMHPYQILFVRQSITVALCTAYGVWSKSVPDFPWGPRGVRWLLVMRGVCGFFGVFGMYYSLLLIPLSEATVLTFLTPILTCYLCSFIIPGETFSRQQQLAGFVSLLGVVFIARPVSLFTGAGHQTTPNPEGTTPPFNNSSAVTNTPASQEEPTPEQHLAAIGIAMIGVLGSTGALTAIRAIGTRAHAFISINYFSVWCTVVSLACLIIFPEVKFRLPGNVTEWSLLVNLGFCGFVMQFLLTEGLSYGGPTTQTHPNQNTAVPPSPMKPGDIESRRTNTLDHGTEPQSAGPRTQQQPGQAPPNPPTSNGAGTRATSMLYTQMLFALAGDKLVFGVTPSTVSWIGSVLILAGAVWVAAARDSSPAIVRQDGSKEGETGGRSAFGAIRLTERGREKNDDETTTAEETLGLVQDYEAREHENEHDDDLDRLKDDQDRGQVEILEMEDLQSPSSSVR